MKKTTRFPTTVLLMCFVVTSACAAGEDRFIFDFSTNGAYRLLVNDVPWLTNGTAFFNNNGVQYSTADNTLKLINTSATSGYDDVGQWQSATCFYLAGSLPVTLSWKTYNYPNLPLVIFSQRYLGSAIKTSGPDSSHVISSFPSFKTATDKNLDLGFLAYGGSMSGYTTLRIGRWDPAASFATGISGGPLVLFDNASNAMVISPLSQFMAAYNQLWPTRQEISYGISGLVDNVPSNYSIDFIVYYSNQGVNEAMRGWGEFLRYYYKKNRYHRTFGTTLNYMGYWTDNGAYYYYNTERNKNYEESILDVASYVKNKSIPFQYTQYDSWWYKKGHEQGVLSWTPEKDILPDGFKYLSDKLQLPFALHNRYWDNETLYARYNGGRYNFISDKKSGLAVPDDDQFWLDLFNMTQEWGQFILYEQDWLDIETNENVVLQSDLSLGRRWLIGMGQGAQAYGNIGIQYCMAYSRHILQSFEIAAVSQARVSNDYSPGGKQWNIGISSMLADAVGLAPFKDTFWTTEVQPGSPYGAKTENKTRLNSVVATLSTGPVGPGDGIGNINLTVLMRCCDSAGRILQPSKPATAVDDQIKRQAFPSYPGPDGEVYSTYSNISGYIFGIVLAAQLNNFYLLTPYRAWATFQLPTSVVYSGTDPSKLPVPFSESAPLSLGPSCSDVNFCLYYTSPVLQLGVRSRLILLGEPEKWVPLSSKRFYDIQQTRDDVVLQLNVNAYEIVTLNFLLDVGPVQSIVCDNSKSANPAYVSSISIAQKSCALN